MRWLGPLKAPKLTANADPLPFDTVSTKEVVWPLVDRDGTICSAVLAPGTPFGPGATIAEGGDSRILAPYGGEVSGIATIACPPFLRSAPALRIKVGSEAGTESVIEAVDDPESLPPDDLWRRVEEARLPTVMMDSVWTSLLPAFSGEISTLVINAADQDLRLCSRIQSARRDKEKLASALSMLRHMTGASSVKLAIPSNVIGEFSDAGVDILPVSLDYPNTLDKAIASSMGGEQGGVRVLPVGLALALHQFITTGDLPDYVDLTVIDRNGKARNLRALYGTPVKAILDVAGIVVADNDRVLLGGAMRGTALYSLETPVVPGIDGLTVLPARKSDDYRSRTCINCGSCIKICPVRLQAHAMGRLCEAGRYQEAADELALCIDCGLCTYVCPTFRPLSQWFMLAKDELNSTKGATNDG